MDLSKKEDRKKYIDSLFSDENIARKKRSLVAFDFYNNNHVKYVRDKLCEEYQNPSDVDSNRNIFSINVTRKVIDATATVYLHEPKREYINANEQDLERIDHLYDITSIDQVLKKANNIYKLVDQCVIQIVPFRGELKVRAMPPHLYDVVCDPDMAEEAIAYVTMRPDPSKKQDNKLVISSSKEAPEDFIYTFWTAESYFKTNSAGELIDEEIRNPIGRLPFIDVSSDKQFEYWIDRPSSIVQFAIEFMLCLCDVANISKLQGFAQAVLASHEKPTDLKIGPNHYIHLQISDDSTVQPSFSFASPNPDLGSSIELLEKMLSMFLSSINVEPSTISTSGKGQTYTSGLDRFLAGVQRFEASKDDVTLFRKVEREVFSLLIDWHNELQDYSDTSEKFNIGTVSFDVMQNVVFSSPELVETDKEKCEIIAKKLEMGLISKLEAIMIDRGISKDDAKKVLEEIASEQTDNAKEIKEIDAPETKKEENNNEF